MVGPLIRLDFQEQRWQNGPIYPPYVPFFLLLGTEPEISLLCAILQDLVLRVAYIDDQRPLAGILGVCVARLPHELP
jgi:hypothetical protein